MNKITDFLFMKNILFTYFLLLSALCFAQKISIKQFNHYDFEKITPLMSYLSSEIPKKYEENDKTTKYDNLFRINTVGKNYSIALSQIDSVRNVYMKSIFPCVYIRISYCNILVGITKMVFTLQIGTIMYSI